MSQKSASLRESIKQLVNEDDANFKRKLISLLRDHQIDNKFSTLMKSDDMPKYTDPMQRRESYKKVSHSLKYHNDYDSIEEDSDIYDFYDDEDDDDYRDSEETFYNSDIVDDFDSDDDDKYDYAYDRAYGALKNSDSYRKRRHPSKYENMHDKELYKSRDPNRGLKHRKSKKGFFSSFSKFLKSSDALYEKELTKLITYDDRTSYRAKKSSGKLKLYFNVISPMLTCALFVFGSIMVVHNPVVVLSSVIAYFITMVYLLYKTVIVAKKCTIQDRINKKRRSELTAARR